MRIILKIVFLVFCFVFVANGQDKLTLRNGRTYNVKITEVSDSIVYFEDNKGEKLSVYKSWIDKIKYQNTAKIKFANPKDTIFNNYNTSFFYNEPQIRKHIDSLLIFYQSGERSFKDYYLKGEADAYLRRNYDGIYRAAFLTTLVFPPAGFIVSYSMLMAPPQINPVYIADPNLLKEEAYLYGYKRMAYKQKSIRIWKGFTLGLLTGSAVYYLIFK